MLQCWFSSNEIVLVHSLIITCYTKSHGNLYLLSYEQNRNVIMWLAASLSHRSIYSFVFMGIKDVNMFLPSYIFKKLIFLKYFKLNYVWQNYSFKDGALVYRAYTVVNVVNIIVLDILYRYKNTIEIFFVLK